jgi:hypothetical protein
MPQVGFDPSVRASEDISSIRRRGHYDWLSLILIVLNGNPKALFGVAIVFKCSPLVHADGSNSLYKNILISQTSRITRLKAKTPIAAF